MVVHLNIIPQKEKSMIMKNKMKKMVTALMILFISAGVFAQEQPNPVPPKPLPPEQQGNLKDEFVRKINDLQPKLNELMLNAKQNASKMPELAQEANNLNDMVAAFKSKVDQLDTTPKEQQQSLVASLNTDWSAIESQYNKVNDLWNRNRPEDASTPTKQQPEEKVPPK